MILSKIFLENNLNYKNKIISIFGGYFMKSIEMVKSLIQYGLDTNLIEESDIYYVSNLLFDVLKIEPPSNYDPHLGKKASLENILKVLLNEAVEREIIEEGIASRDLFDTRIMNCLTPRPSIVRKEFSERYKQSPSLATDYFYKLSCDSDYIRRYRIIKDKKWVTKTKYGNLDITINLSKPEKDPKAIAASANSKEKKYPHDLLCHTNEGYAGRLDHPARFTLRQIPIELDHELWYMQYSPYVYYNEHCIVLTDENRPMCIEKATFQRLLEFLDIFPHYTIGSNADLPIVGGSILSHEHFQGGNYTFAMAKAKIRKKINFQMYPEIKAGIVDWPMSVIRLDGKDKTQLVELSNQILETWINYDDPTCDILSHTGEIRHNTITPIARMKDGQYELDLVLRNNRTTDEYPLGIFHPHNELHHIKKENIGLIEVMGLAVLPARLQKEMEELKQAILTKKDVASIPSISHHANWANMLLQKYTFNLDNINQIIEDEIGYVFAKVLEDAGVFKNTPIGNKRFDQFIQIF